MFLMIILVYFAVEEALVSQCAVVVKSTDRTYSVASTVTRGETLLSADMQSDHLVGYVRPMNSGITFDEYVKTLLSNAGQAGAVDVGAHSVPMGESRYCSIRSYRICITQWGIN